MPRTVNAEITRIEDAAEATFFDNGKVITCSSYVQDSYGEQVLIKISGAELACGYQIVNGSTNFRGELIISEVDAKVRLPRGTNITVVDEFLLTKKNGASTNLLYKVDAVLSGISCVTALLKSLES